MQEAQVGQLAPPLLEIEAVADEELVRHDEADVADREIVDESAVGAVEQRDGGDLARLAKLERAHEVVQREPGVDDVLDDDHVAVGGRRRRGP